MESPADGHQDPYLTTLDITTSENLKLYNKEILGYRKTAGMTWPDPSGPTFTNNWRIMYPHYLDSNQQLWLQQTYMESM